jgi:hypothetical protein
LTRWEVQYRLDVLDDVARRLDLPLPSDTTPCEAIVDAIASTVDVLKAPHLNRRTLTREIIRALLVCIAGAETGDGDVSLATLRTLTHLSGRSTAMLRKIRDLKRDFLDLKSECVCVCVP